MFLYAHGPICIAFITATSKSIVAKSNKSCMICTIVRDSYAVMSKYNTYYVHWCRQLKCIVTFAAFLPMDHLHWNKRRQNFLGHFFHFAHPDSHNLVESIKIDFPPTKSASALPDSNNLEL